jgi:hypothetical protein
MAERGRPSIFSEELATRICERLALGESLNKICEDDAMPGLRTVHDWLASNNVFSAQYSRARAQQADTFADRVMDKAETVTNDNAAAVRAYLESVKWFAGVTAPRKYGLKQTIAGDPESPIRTITEIRTTIVDPKAPA